MIEFIHQLLLSVLLCLRFLRGFVCLFSILRPIYFKIKRFIQYLQDIDKYDNHIYTWIVQGKNSLPIAVEN